MKDFRLVVAFGLIVAFCGYHFRDAMESSTVAKPVILHESEWL